MENLEKAIQEIKELLPGMDPKSFSWSSFGVSGSDARDLLVADPALSLCASASVDAVRFLLVPAFALSVGVVDL